MENDIKTKISYREALKMVSCFLQNDRTRFWEDDGDDTAACSKQLIPRKFGEERIMDVQLSEAGLWVQELAPQ
jgi:hypothetical protein